MQGLALAFDGCVYVGAYQATGGAIQLFLTLAPIGRGLGTRTASHVVDPPYPGIASGAGDALNGIRLGQQLARESAAPDACGRARPRRTT